MNAASNLCNIYLHENYHVRLITEKNTETYCPMVSFELCLRSMLTIFLIRSLKDRMYLFLFR